MRRSNPDAGVTNPVRRIGRPAGSKNKPKPVLSRTELLAFRDRVGPYLPTKDIEYISGVLTGEIEPDLDKDVDIVMAMQLKALLPALADDIRNVTLGKEVTARSTVVKELLALRFQMRKHEQGDDNTKPSYVTFIQATFEGRGIDKNRLAELIGRSDSGRTPVSPLLVSGPVSRSSDQDEGRTNEARAVSGEVLERQQQVPGGSEESPDRVQLDHGGGGSPPSDREPGPADQFRFDDSD